MNALISQVSGPKSLLPNLSHSVLDFYEELKFFADYGPAFQRVMEGYRGDKEVLVRVKAEDVDLG